MRKTIALFALWSSICVVGCQRINQVSPDWRQEQQENLKLYASQLKDRVNDVKLSVSHVVPMDEKTFLLGGSYRTDAGSFRSVLLRSTDGGKSWRDTDVWLVGCDTWRIFVLDEKHAHAVVNWSIEGWLTPFVIFRTADGGATWRRSEQDLPLEPIGIPYKADLSFASPRHGQFRVTGSTGEKLHHRTTDGGRTWKLTHVSTCPVDVEPAECKHEYDRARARVRILYRAPDRSEFETLSVIDARVSIDEQGRITPEPSPAGRSGKPSKQ